MFKKISWIVAVVFAVCPLTLYGQARNPPAWFWGCWVVQQPLLSADGASLSTEDQEELVGAKFMFHPDKAIFGISVTNPAHYTVHVLSGDAFQSRTHLRLDQIGVTGSEVTEIKLSGTDSTGLGFSWNDVGVFLRKNDIVFHIEQDYFVVTRAKAQDPDCRGLDDLAKGGNHLEIQVQSTKRSPNEKWTAIVQMEVNSTPLFVSEADYVVRLKGPAQKDRMGDLVMVQEVNSPDPPPTVEWDGSKLVITLAAGETYLHLVPSVDGVSVVVKQK